MSVIVFAGYLLFIFFVSSKPFSLILSIGITIYQNFDFDIHLDLDQNDKSGHYCTHLSTENVEY